MVCAMCNTTTSTTAVFEFLEEYFSDQVIALHYSRVTDIGMDKLLYSQNLKSFDFFFWGYLKDAVYYKNPLTVDELE